MSKFVARTPRLKSTNSLRIFDTGDMIKKIVVQSHLLPPVAVEGRPDALLFAIFILCMGLGWVNPDYQMEDSVFKICSLRVRPLSWWCTESTKINKVPV